MQIANYDFAEKNIIVIISLMLAQNTVVRSGVLRAAINMSNFLLVPSRGPHGEPQGVSPDLAASLASKLGVSLQLIPYENPGSLSDAATNDEWDVAFVGSEPARATTIAFTQPYVEIEATFLVRDKKAFDAIGSVDRPDVSIVVSARTAYDLWLTQNLKNASLHRPDKPGLERSLVMFQEGHHDILAGLRPWLEETVLPCLPESHILAGSFTTVQQAIGVPRHVSDGGMSLFLERFVEESIATGYVESLICKYDAVGKLKVAML